MSDFERSLLERKDRDELAKIAGSLGQKPPSRAKKADMIDLILRLAGVPFEASPAPDPSPSDRDHGDGDGPQGADAARNGEAARSGDAREAEDESATALVVGAESRGAEQADDRSRPGPSPSRGHDWQRVAPRSLDQPASGNRDPNGAPQDGSPAQTESPADPPPPAQAPQGATPPAPQQGSEQERVAAAAAPDNPDRPTQIPQGEPSPNRQTQPQQGGQGQPQQGRPAPSPQGGQGQPQPGGQGAGQADGEGNRRRRRRGRDRQGQGQGQNVGQGQGGPQGGSQPEEVFQGEPVDVEGLLDLRDEGFGFLRVKGYLPTKDDVYVSVKQARQFALRKGDRLTGKSRPAGRNEKNPALLQIDSVNGQDPETMKQRPHFEDLTALFPDERLSLELADDPGNMTARIIDLLAPVGKGQRGLIVSPPKAGKTTVMKQIARSIELNDPDVRLIVLLVDERPEEVTDMRRWLKHGEVAASTFDRPSEEHTQVAELVIERAKRLVEEGADVVIILDGITRLARAYNLAAPATGRIMSGGIDTGALYPPKKFFGAARNVEEGGSLTILATALVETGSRMDEVIFEEFKGTGNMEIKLDRRLADRRIYPAIDVAASSTRHEELLFDRRQLQQVWKLRRVLSGLGGEGASTAAGLELLIDRMKSFKSNDAFLAEIAKAPTAGG